MTREGIASGACGVAVSRATTVLDWKTEEVLDRAGATGIEQRGVRSRCGELTLVATRDKGIPFEKTSHHLRQPTAAHPARGDPCGPIPLRPGDPPYEPTVE